MPRPKALSLFIPITKIDVEKREVWGTLTHEVGDRDGEIFDYESSKPYFESWTDGVEKITDGKSKGAVRAMHQPIAAGKIIAMDFDDAARKIDIGTKIVDDAEWDKCLEGVYTGFSAGGKYVRKWRDPLDKGLTRFTANPHEASLVDVPCVPTATFDLVKAGGLVEKRGFKKVAARTDTTPIEGTERYGDVDFADEKNKKYPLDTKAHIRNALARWGDEKNRAKYSAEDQKTIGGKIRAAAKREGITVSTKAMLAGDFNKGLFEIGALAELAQRLAWLQQQSAFEREMEGDGSTVPDSLKEHLEGLLEDLEDMTGEEIDELLEQLNRTAEPKKTTKAVASGTTTSTLAGATTMKDNTFKKIKKAHAEQLDDIVDHANAVNKLFGEHTKSLEGTKHHEMAKALLSMHKGMCDKLEGFQEDVGGLPETEPVGDEEHSVTGAEKIAKVAGERDELAKKLAAAEATIAAGTGAAGGDDAMKKVLAEKDAALAKAATENGELTKQLNEALDLGEQLLQKAKGTLTIVDRAGDGVNGGAPVKKGADGGAAAGDKPPTDEELAKMTDGERSTLFKAAAKKAFGRPKLVTGFGEPVELNPEPAAAGV
jgi:hypothetical protein